MQTQKKIILRPYQTDFEQAIYKGWQSGAKNVLGVLPTGAGKTVVFAKILADHPGRCCAIAHRQELVGQISLALAQRGVEHQIVGPTNVVKFAVSRQIEDVGTSFYSPGARVTVAGVDTLIRRRKSLTDWAAGNTLWVQDEAHHVLRKNKWGKAAAMFPNARGLGVTATPIRADGRGLGRHHDGLMDAMMSGPEMRYLIDDGYLTDYRLFAPASDLNLDDLDIAANGDYSKPQLKKAVQKSRIVGDVVEHYQRIAPGKLGITFAVDVEMAVEITEQYRAAGVPAEVVSHKTPDASRQAILRQFRDRKILQLVNVDLFGEGFDLPAVEVVSFARPTQSYALYCQQFGRALRLMTDGPMRDTREGRIAAIAASRKPTAIIIDHVGNILRHNLPDAKRTWTLDRRDKRAKRDNDGLLPLTACPECTAPYERVLICCPYCGYVPEPQNRSGPEYVDGDLCELDPTVLAAMRGDVARVDMDSEAYRAELRRNRCNDPAWQGAHVKRHMSAQESQASLRSVMALWAGWQISKGNIGERENQRRFYLTFNVDVLTAQALGQKEAAELAEQITKEMLR